MLRRDGRTIEILPRKDAEMNILKGEKATQFVAWLSVVKGFLPKSMSIEEASQIFLRRCKDEEEAKKDEKKNG